LENILQWFLPKTMKFYKEKMIYLKNSIKIVKIKFIKMKFL
jgi:hypothetical protein